MGKLLREPPGQATSSVLAVSFVKGERTRNFAFVSLCYGTSGEEICTGYAMAASGRMQYDYKQTNKPQV